MFTILTVLKYLVLTLVFTRTIIKEPVSFCLAAMIALILINDFWRSFYRDTNQKVNSITLLLDLILAFFFSIFAKSGYDKLFMIYLVEGTVILPKPYFIIYAALTGMVYTGAIALQNLRNIEPINISFFELLLYLFVFLLVWSERRQREQRLVYERLTKELRYVNFELKESLALNERLASEAERRKIIAEVHDSLGYHLTGLLFTLQAGKKLMAHDLESAKTYWDKGIELVRVAIGSVRELVSVKKESDFEFELVFHLKEIVKEVQSLTGFMVTFDIKTHDIMLSGKEQFSLYRIFQEAITNTLRHSNANRASIVISGDQEWLDFVYEDNGTGTKRFEEGNGLKGMRDRISYLNGSIHFSSQSGGGFKIEGRINKRGKEA